MKVFLVHGYGANVHSHWFDWLGEQLYAKSIDYQVLEMPDSGNPVLADWLSLLRDKIVIDEKSAAQTVIIGHSLGTYTIANFLETIPFPIKAAIYVAGFAEFLPAIPALDVFLSKKIDFDKLKKNAAQQFVFASTNDEFVPFEFSVDFASKLDAELFSIENAGHFMASDGFTTFPALRLLVESLT